MPINLSAFDDDVNGEPQEPDDIPKEPFFLGNDCLEAFVTFRTVRGKERERSVITLGFNGREWYARLVDSDNNRSLTAEGDCINAACFHLEAKVQSTPVRWYYWKTGKGGASKKKRVS